MLLSRLAQRYVDERGRRGELAPLSVRHQRNSLRAFCVAVGDPSADRLTRRAVERWLENYDAAPSTKRTALSALRVFCKWAVVRRYMRTDPTAGVKGPRLPRSLPRGLRREQIARLLLACPDERARLIVLLACQEGLRRAEIARLTVEDLDPRDRVLFVKGKGGHERVLPVSEETMSALGLYMARFPASSGPLVRSYTRSRRALSPHTVGILVTRWMDAAGIKVRAFDGVSTHALRHSACGDMLRSGAHVRDVQAAMGHVSLATTSRYMPLIVDDLRRAMGGRRYGGSLMAVIEPQGLGSPRGEPEGEQ